MGFLGTAAMTAAGVAGGIMAANALSNMFSGGSHGSQGTGAQAAALPSSSPDAASAPQQPASYEEPGSYGSNAQEASYDDGGDFGGGGGDDWA
jgi:uncharacterized protein